MKANPSAPEGLALEGASAVLRAWHPLPCRANAAHAEYLDRLLDRVHVYSLASGAMFCLLWDRFESNQ